MNALELLTELSKQGVKVWTDGKQLRYRAPKGVMTATLLSKLAEDKAELITFLSQQRERDLAMTLPQIVPAPDQLYQPFPITDVQQAYWLGRNATFELGNVASHGYIEVEAVGLDLDRSLLILRQLIERHPMLRAIILPDGQQKILEHVPPFQIEVIDLAGLDRQEVDKRLEHIRDEMDHQVFQAEQWPVFEIRVSRLDKRYMRVHVSMEALFTDSWSIGNLLREFSHLYHEPEASLPPLEISFRDYVLAEAHLRDLELYRRSQDYWFKRLQELPPAPDLPLAIDTASLKRPRFVPRKARLVASVWQRLKTRSAQARLTASGILLAAFAEVLTTWSKIPRFCINITIFNLLPLHKQVNEIMGDFTSLLLLAVDNSHPGTFENRARRLQEQFWRDFDHCYYNGIRVLRDLARMQEDTRQTIMPVVFTSLLGQEMDATYPAPWQETVYFVTQTPQVWLDHQAVEEAGDLVLYWHAVEALFPPGLLDEMFDAYVRFLQRLAIDEAIWQSYSSELVPSSQLIQRALINTTEASLSDQLLHSLFLEQALKNPNHMAVISARRSLTYQEILNESTLLGQQLRELGVHPNHLVAVVMEKGWEQVVGVLGVLLSGAAYLPIDPKLPQERLIFLLEHGEVEVVITQSWLEKRVPWPGQIKPICVDTLDLTTTDMQLLESRQGPDDLAYVIYTSGSTGLPKGVMIHHRGAVNTILDINERFGVSNQDRVMALSALNFDLSVYDIFGVLASGATLVLPPEDAIRDPSVWLELLVQERITLWNTVPKLLEMLVDYIEIRPQAMSGSCLRLALLSGDWIPISLPAQLRKLIPTVEIISLGGATEASIWSILYPIHAVDPSWKSIPYGKPMRNQSLFVLNEKLEPCPVWVPGHLYIGGVGLAKGYWRDEEKTQASFLVHPQTDERLYRTGDLGRYLPDGNIEFLGREDFQVKVGGHRIELGEIEATLLEHPQVSKAVATVIGKRFENKHIVAYLVPAQNGSSQIDDTEDGVNWETLLNNSQVCRQALSELEVNDAFLEVWQTLEEIALHIVCKALNDFGVFGTAYEHYSVEELIQHCTIHPRYTRWIKRNLGVLVQNGYLREQDGVFICEKPLPLIAVDELWSTYQKVAAKLAVPPLHALGWDNDIPILPSQRVKNLKAVLTEKLHSAEIYVSTEIRDAYRIFHDSNILIQTIVKELVWLIPPDKKLRLLEIGAGFGTTTECILSVLPAERTEYVYTDISAYFLQEAQEKFAQYSFVEYRLLDMQENPYVQGYQLHDFDLIIAAGVVHATRNIAETLTHIRALLKPHGLLLFLEATRFHPIIDLTMGLQQGVDRFEDTDLRQSHAFLSRESWQEVLRKQEFVSSAIFHKVGTLTDFLGFDVLLAQGPASITMLELTNIYEHLRSKLPEYMVPSRIIPLEMLPLTANGKVNRKALPVPVIQSREQAKGSRAARTPTEKALVQLWSEILKLSDVSIEDDFLGLGGDSLLATKLLARIKMKFDIELPFQVIFKNPTIATMAEAIEQYQLHQRSERLAQREQHSDEEVRRQLQVVPAPDQLYQSFPTTDVQQAYWIGRRAAFELGNVGNHIYVEVEAVDLDLDRSLLILRCLIERHPMLRAVMLPDGQQQILEHVPLFQIEVIDLEELTQQEVAGQLAQIREEMDHQVLQVEQWPAFDIRVSRLGMQRVRVHISLEFLFIDGMSLGMLFREFLHLYHEPETYLPALEISFRDYMLAETQLQGTVLYWRSQDYWSKRLQDLPPAPDLPLAMDPRVLERPQFVPRKARLEALEWQRLKARGARTGLTPSGILLAGFAEVLSTWSKTPRFCINLCIFQRLPLHEQVHDIIGDFTSLLLLAVDHSLPDTFEERAKRLQEQLWRDFDHRYYSGVRVLRDIAYMQGRTAQAIMPVVFTSLLSQEASTTYPTPWQELNYFVAQTPQVWLDHQVLEEAGNLLLYWQAVEALFPAGLLDEMFDAYIHFLHRLAIDEEVWQSHSCELIPSSQLAQRALINKTEAPISGQLLHCLFLEQASKNPNHIAVISARRSLTYREALNGAMLLGQQLRQRGARPNHLVAVVMEKGWEQVVGVLGVVLSGAAYLPIDPKLPQERLIFLLEHGEVEMIVTQSWIEKTIQWPDGLKRLCVDELEVAGVDMEPLDVRQVPDDLAYVIYTSGSTGLPKGVMIDHRGAVNTILDINERFGVSSQDRVLALSALSFDLSVYDIFGVLAAGGTIVMPAEDAIRDPSAWLELLVQERITLWNTVPALLEMLVDYTEAFSGALSGSWLRLALLSGDWLPVALPSRLSKLIPIVQIVSLGGATEASIWSILYPITVVNPSWKSIPYGQPLCNQQICVLNEKLEPCPVWVPGHLYIGGVGLAKGYWRDEEKTQASFLMHPKTGERFYRTGDLGRYLPDGNIEFLGREDFQVKVGGHRIELGEIEAMLLEHPQVSRAVATVVGKRFENKHLVAYIVPAQLHADLTEHADLNKAGVLTNFLSFDVELTQSASSTKKSQLTQMYEYLRSKLPEYMVPSKIILLEMLPLTSNGKIDRNALPDPMIQSWERVSSPKVARTSTERTLVQLWSQVLKLSDISVEENFFELGGNSLLATKLLARIRTTFNIELPLRAIFENLTIAAMAEAIERY